MKPGLIQVFDGLRITTQHLNHLQGSFHSAIQDIRQILGTGRVHSGFEVVKESDNKIKVLPGIAFDFERNRIVCDEPKTLDVVFQTSQKSLYVCIKYEQVQEGIVESVATLIYDSCSVIILPDLPESNENLIIIAVLHAQNNNGDFSIVLPASDDSALTLEIDNEAETKSDETTPVKPDNQLVSGGDIDAIPKEMEGTNLEESNLTTETIEMLGEDKPDLSAEIPLLVEDESNTTDLPITDALQRSLQCGVVHLNSEPDKKIPIGSALVEVLKIKLNQESKSVYIRFAQLSSIELPITLQPNALAVDMVLKAEIGVEDEETVGAPTVWNYLSTSHGQAIMGKDAINQYATAMLHGKSSSSMPMFQLIDSDITQDGIAQIQFQPFSLIPDELEFLRYLGLHVFVQSDEKSRHFFVANAIWKGTVSETIVEAVIKHKPYILWEANAAWKAYRTIKPNEIK